MSRPLLSLVMIVKDEAAGIEATIASVREHVDRYDILDTGSTDGTQDLIRRAFGVLPGEVYEEPFVDYGTTRNRAFELATGRAEFLLMLSGDESVHGGAALRAFCTERATAEDEGAYLIQLKWGRLSFCLPRMVRSGSGWRYIGKTHEYLHKDGSGLPALRVPGVSIFHDLAHADMERKRRTWLRDLELLEEERRAHPEDMRTLFYLGQTLHDLGRFAEAATAYGQRAALGGWREEAYEALYRRAQCLYGAGEPWPVAQQAYLDAHSHSPHRAEPLFRIAEHWYQAGNRPLAYLFALRACDLPYPSGDAYFIDEEIYAFKRHDLLGIVAYYQGDFVRGEAAVRRALAHQPEAPHLHENLRFYQAALARKQAPIAAAAVARAVKRIALYAHYDPRGRIDPYVLHTLEALRAVCDDVWFVSTAALDGAAIAAAKAHCGRVWLRNNAGYDFAMWQYGLGEVDLDAWDEVVLANSSVLGPVPGALEEMFAAMAGRDCDVWSATDNFEIAWHLQSYFLVFRKRALAAPAFARFWDSVLPYRSKDQVIASYELGLSRFLDEAGLRLEAFLPLRTLLADGTIREAHAFANPTIFYPTALLDRGLPFVKASVLRDNPARVVGVWEALFDRGYDPASSGVGLGPAPSEDSVAWVHRPRYRAAAARRRGLEIGGPSDVFAGALPLYRWAEQVDNVVFRAETLWAQNAGEGEPFRFRPDRAGVQYLREATALTGIADASYDFVAASHVLEHVANPLRALREWRRVLRPGGALVLLVPSKDATFDHRRPVTALSHLLEDEARGVGEDDLTHLDEILALHDLTRDPGAGTAAEFEARSRDNATHRALHHHVFDPETAAAALRTAGFRVDAVDLFRPFHIALLARC